MKKFCNLGTRVQKSLKFRFTPSNYLMVSLSDCPTVRLMQVYEGLEGGCLVFTATATLYAKKLHD